MATKQAERLTQLRLTAKDAEIIRLGVQGIHYKELRKARGLSLEEVSNQIGASMSAISLFERGKLDLPPAAMQLLEENVLKLSPEDRQSNVKARQVASEARELMGFAKYLPWLWHSWKFSSAEFYGESGTAEENKMAAHVAKVAMEAKKGEALGIDPLLSTIIIYEKQLEALRANIQQMLKAYETQDRFFGEVSHVQAEKNRQLEIELKQCKATVARIAKQTRPFGESE